MNSFDKKLVAICASVVSIIVVVAVWYIVVIEPQNNAWNQIVKDRVNREIQESNINFNRTEPKVVQSITDYHCCQDEEQWQEVNDKLLNLFEFMKNDAPKGSTFHIYETCPYVYIGYVHQTFVGPVFVGYRIRLYQDC